MSRLCVCGVLVVESTSVIERNALVRTLNCQQTETASLHVLKRVAQRVYLHYCLLGSAGGRRTW